MTCKEQITGFFRTQKSFSRTFQGTFHSKRGLHEAEKVHIQNQSSVYLHYSNETEMQYLRLYYCIPMNPD